MGLGPSIIRDCPCKKQKICFVYRGRRIAWLRNYWVCGDWIPQDNELYLMCRECFDGLPLYYKPLFTEDQAFYTHGM